MEKVQALPWTGIDLAVPQRYALEDENGYASGQMKALWQQEWEVRRGIIFIGAAGIAVRMAAPLLEGKFLDPAVLVIDEAGQHVISLLSGHWGGGNDLARQVALALGAVPVITTATDTLALPAFDLAAKELKLTPVPFTAFRQANAAIVNEEPVSVIGGILPGNWPDNISFYPAAEKFPEDGSYRISCGFRRRIGTQLALVPHCVFAGIGCRRGVSPEEIQAAVVQAFGDANSYMEALAGAATVTLKQDETGLLQGMAELKLPLVFYSPEELSQVDGLYTSDFVRQIAGCSGVSEQAAFLLSGGGELLLRRRVYGRVTVALAIGKAKD